MKFILLLLLVLGCGKKNTASTYFEITQNELAQDSDADGMKDWDEINAGRDPYIADLNFELDYPQGKIDLIQNDQQVKSWIPQYYRTLRVALLKGDKLPLQNSVLISLNSQVKFWEYLFTTPTIKSMRVRFKDKAEKVFPLQRNFSEEASYSLTPAIAEKQGLNLNQQTYRLVISTPEKEVIYHLHPSIDPKEFLLKKHQIRFDQNDEVIAVDNREQNIPHPFRPDYSDELLVWKAYGWDLQLRHSDLKAGKTLALVLTSIKEIKHAFSLNTSFKHDVNYTQTIDSAVPVRFFIKIKSTSQISWTSKEVIEIVNSNHRERDRTCVYTEGNARTISESVSNQQQAEALISHHGFSNLKLTKFIKTAGGAIAEFSGLLQPGDLSIKWNQQFIQESKPVGVYKSTCGNLKKVNAKPTQIRPNFTADFYWIAPSM